MRVLVLLWSVWILCLSMAPCCWEDDACVSELCTEAADTAEGHHPDPTHTDHPVDAPDQACSPFVLCGNCSGFVISPSAFLSEETIPLASRRANLFYALSFWASAWLSPVWQPPQFGFPFK